MLIGPGQGEVIGDAPDRRVEILSDHDALNATWSRFAPGREGAELHVHRRHTDLFYVLAGELTVRLGADGGEVVAPAGTLVRVPPMVVHGFANTSRAEVRYLNLHAPGRRFADYLRAMRDGRTFVYDQEPPPDDGVRPASEATVGRPGMADVEAIGVDELSLEPGGPPLPGARDRLRSLFVLEGELALTADGGEVRAPAGSWVRIPAGVAHALEAADGGRVRALDVRTPA
jgi:uncharacterized cupin superfamily protein